MRSIVEDANLLANVHRHVVVAILSQQYVGLADHLQMQINLAFTRLRRGRLVQRVRYENQTIYLLTILPTASNVGTVEDEEDLNEAFQLAGGVGRVTTDKFELRLASKLVNKFGTAE